MQLEKTLKWNLDSMNKIVGKGYSQMQNSDSGGGANYLLHASPNQTLG